MTPVKIRVRELLAGDVDAHDARRRVAESLLPGNHLLAGLRQNLAPDEHDHFRVFRNRNEVCRVDEALRRVPPAHQRLESRKRAAANRDDRLVKHLERSALDGLPHVGFDTEPRYGAVAHPDIEELAARGAALFRTLQRDAGVAEDVLRIRVPRSADGDAGARGDEYLLSLDLEGPLKCFAQALRHPHGIARVVDVVEEYREFVTTEPGQREPVATVRQGIGCSEAGLKTARHLDQQPIRRRQPEAVIDRLEPIEAEAHQRKLVVTPAYCAVDCALQEVEKQDAVRQARQAVRELDVRDVGQRAGETRCAAGLISDRRRAAEHPSERSIAMAEPVLAFVVPVAVSYVRGHRLADAAPVVLVQSVEPFVWRDRDLGVLVPSIDFHRGDQYTSLVARFQSHKPSFAPLTASV